MALADDSAGATSTATITFTTASGLADDDRIEILFPVGFDLGAVGAGDGSCSTMDGSFATTVIGQLVRITRSGGSSQPAGAESCTIADVENPQVSGLTGTYTIQTYTLVLAVYVLQDSGVASAISLSTATLGATNVEPASLLAGATGIVTATFTTVNPIPSDGALDVTFPSGFDVSGANAGDCSSMDGSFATSVSGQVVTLTRSGGSSEPAGAQSCTIDGITNPPASGSSGAYQIQSLTSSLDVIDEALSVAADTILPNSLAASNVEPASLLVGAVGTITITYTNFNPIPDDGAIEVTLPADFDVSGATGGDCSSMDGSFSTAVSGQVVTLTRSGGSSAAPGAQSCSVDGIANPDAGGSAGSYAVKTLNSALATIDQDLNIGADTILANVLSATSIVPDDPQQGAVGGVSILFTTTNPIPDDGSIQVTFPAGFDLGQVGAGDGACSSLDGAISTGVAGQVVTLTRSGGTVEAAGAQVCSLEDVTNPTAGTTGTFVLKTLDGALAAIDQELAVAGALIEAGAITSAVVDVGKERPNRITDVTFTWTGAAALPIDGKIRLTFPDGYSLDTVTGTECGSDGTVAHSIAGQVITIVRQADGTAEAAGEHVCKVLGAKTPPDVGEYGDFALEVLNAADLPIESESGIQGPPIIVVHSSGGGGGGDSGGDPGVAGGDDIPASDDGNGTDDPEGASGLLGGAEDPIDLEIEDPIGGIESILLRVTGDVGLNVTRLTARGSPPEGFEPTDLYFRATLSEDSLLREATIIVALPADVTPRQAVLLHHDGDGWKPLPGTLQKDRLLVKTTSFSLFWLVQDVQGPQHTKLKVDDDGLLHGQWQENQERAKARLWIGDRLVADAEDAVALRFNSTGQSIGEHIVKLLVTDPAGFEEVAYATLTIGQDGNWSLQRRDGPTGAIHPVPDAGPAFLAVALAALVFVLRRRL